MSVQNKISSIYLKSILEKTINLNICEIGNNLNDIITTKLEHAFSGKCISEGFIRPNSIKLLNYSSGKLSNNAVQYIANFECLICLPVEGQTVTCKIKSITKAGIHGIVEDGEYTPLHVFVAKDHHVMVKEFNEIKEDSSIIVKIIGTKYELNDEHIYSIGKICNEEDEKIAMKDKKKKIRVLDE